MKLTRDNHHRYMGKLAPLLLLALVVQCILYQRFVPQEMANDVSIFVGVGICLILIGGYIHNEYHRVHLRENYLELKFDLLNYHQEILYRNIVEIDVDSKRHGYSNVKLTLKDGTTHRILYIDQGDVLYKTVLEKGRLV
jgi:hypothetical protein